MTMIQSSAVAVRLSRKNRENLSELEKATFTEVLSGVTSHEYSAAVFFVCLFVCFISRVLICQDIDT